MLDYYGRKRANAIKWTVFISPANNITNRKKTVCLIEMCVFF